MIDRTIENIREVDEERLQDTGERVIVQMNEQVRGEGAGVQHGRLGLEGSR